MSIISFQCRSNERLGSNYPGLFDPSFETDIDRLASYGQVSTNVWSGYYWPHKFGGIAMRWMQVRDLSHPPMSTNPHYYSTYTENDVYNMSRQQLLSLSPAEKYDIYMGRFDFPTVAKERQRTNPSNPLWFGICEGWTASSLNYQEPDAFDLRLVNGITLPFAASDIKALLAYGESQFNPGVRSAIGRRCNSGIGDECWDTNPGSFHIILGNYIGRKQQSFAMDVERDAEVWNQPVYAYETNLRRSSSINRNAAPGTVEEMIATTKVWYIQESAPQYFKLQKPVMKSKVFEYSLELNRDRRIIGGEWISFERPDFLWLPKASSTDMHGYYSEVKRLYTWSIGRQ